MSHRLDLAEFRQRIRDQGTELTVQVAALLQGGVLSSAAFSLIAILQDHDDTVIRLVLWLNFVIISLVSFFQICQRSILIMRMGLEVTLMLPVLALFEIIPFAVLSSDGLGPDGWRYWYVADTLAFAAGLLASWLSLRSVKPEDYEEDAVVAFNAAKTANRQGCLSGLAATLLTLSLTVWIFAMPQDWPHALMFVSGHLALTIASAALIFWREGRDKAALFAAVQL